VVGGEMKSILEDAIIFRPDHQENWYINRERCPWNGLIMNG